ncbi:MAG: hypothetical protein K2Y22_16050 [Candidatus Obscuribacterales bacterium]|nr:hypothetical protein [Candidatus Obscuribacterales bacterium]
MVENNRYKDAEERARPSIETGVKIDRIIEGAGQASKILEKQELQTTAASGKYLEAVEITNSPPSRGNSLDDNYVDGSRTKNPDERDKAQIDSLPRTLQVWEERLDIALKALSDDPQSEQLLVEQQGNYAKASKNLARYMTAEQKRELMEMADKATDILLERQLERGDIEGAFKTLGAKLDIDSNLTANAPRPHKHLIKDLQKMVELCQKYHRADSWYWEDKLKQETQN